MAENGEVKLELPVRILVTGDTHFRSTSRRLPDEFFEQASKAGVIVHTGDFSSIEAMNELQDLAKLVAVSGNNDDVDIQKRCPGRVILRAGSLRILVTHGHLERGSSAREGVRRAYAAEYDIVIYGHSHMPEWEQVKGTWFLNPGSPTNRRRAPRYSFAMLEISEDETFDVAFCYFDSPG